jgi:hypothetical protein
MTQTIRGLFAVVFLVLVACRPAPQPHLPTSDEMTLRRDWTLPADASMVELRAAPPVGGTFGREGLRIVATFRISKPTMEAWLKSFRPKDWKPLPLDPGILNLEAAPSEIPTKVTAGHYLCDVRPFGSPLPSFAPFSPGTPLGRLAAYRIAVADPASGLIVIVEKRHY